MIGDHIRIGIATEMAPPEWQTHLQLNTGKLATNLEVRRIVVADSETHTDDVWRCTDGSDLARQKVAKARGRRRVGAKGKRRAKVASRSRSKGQDKNRIWTKMEEVRQKLSPLWQRGQHGTRLLVGERANTVQELAQVKSAVECCFIVAISTFDRSESSRSPPCHLR